MFWLASGIRVSVRSKMIEFDKGDVVVKIGMLTRWIVWDIEPPMGNLGSAYMRCFLRDTSVQVGGHYDNDDFGSIGIEKLEYMKVLKDRYVKVGRWDMDNNREVDDE